MNYRKFVKESSAIRYSLNNKNVVCYSRDTDSVYMNGKKLTNEEDHTAKTMVIEGTDYSGQLTETQLTILKEASQNGEEALF